MSDDDIRILRDIAYGTARVGYNGSAGPMTERVLAMDAYLPQPRPAQAVPALVLAFGGAFHRGSKENDCFPDAGAYGPNTAVAEYCRRFARAGFACFSVAYRLAPDDPDPGTTPVLTQKAVPLDRVAQVREIMRLPPITPQAMAGIVEAAIDDVTAAARAVVARAGEFGVDPTRVVLGGWSAGARCALFAAYAERVPCAGVIALSGAMAEADIATYLPAGMAHPPLLLFSAEHDIGYIRDGAASMVAAMRARGCDVRHVSIPGRDHWYAAEAATADGPAVEAVLRDALRRWTGA
ncbi:MAG: alpha/beta hydrolase fold domain-containing protein [Proteobacteria bacterium]|nr:alpha/beta hydrolase fold domain-containing protein [Pseudomonadota bacterium]